MATNGSAIDLTALWKQYPKDSPHQRHLVLSEIYQQAQPTLNAFWTERFAPRNNILTGQTPPPLHGDTLTRADWRRLFEMLGFGEADIRGALWRLGVGV